jgi:hypothetical protein
MLALFQIAGIHAASEARGAPPPRPLLHTRVSRYAGWWLRHRNFFKRAYEMHDPSGAARAACGPADHSAPTALPHGILLVKEGATPEETVGSGGGAGVLSRRGCGEAAGVVVGCALCSAVGTRV